MLYLQHASQMASYSRCQEGTKMQEACPPYRRAKQGHHLAPDDKGSPLALIQQAVSAVVQGAMPTVVAHPVSSSVAGTGRAPRHDTDAWVPRPRHTQPPHQACMKTTCRIRTGDEATVYQVRMRKRSPLMRRTTLSRTTSHMRRYRGSGSKNT